jgi:hypothetical protein
VERVAVGRRLAPPALLPGTSRSMVTAIASGVVSMKLSGEIQ